MRDIVFLSGKIRNWFFITCFLCVFVDISAQKNADFSGTWNMDFVKSDANYKKFYSGMTCVIKQTPPEITVERTSMDKNGKEAKQDPLTCSLDGKEISKEQYGGIDKYSTGWSGDRKIMILKCVRTINGSDYGSNESYSLKGESPVTEVYNKK